MDFLQRLLLIGLNPLNPLEESLLAFLKEAVMPEQFETALLRSKVVVLLKEAPVDPAKGGIRPLVIDGAGGRPALCVFTHRERSLPLAKSAPEYGCALETDFSWVLAITPPGVGMMFNPGTRFGTELTAEGVDALR